LTISNYQLAITNYQQFNMFLQADAAIALGIKTSDSAIDLPK